MDPQPLHRPFSQPWTDVGYCKWKDPNGEPLRGIPIFGSPPGTQGKIPCPWSCQCCMFRWVLTFPWGRGGTGLRELSWGQQCLGELDGHKPPLTCWQPYLAIPAARRLHNSLREALNLASPAWAPPSVWPENILYLTGALKGSVPPFPALEGCRDTSAAHPDPASPQSSLEIEQGSKASIAAQGGEGQGEL